jgi:hypothetical protein
MAETRAKRGGEARGLRLVRSWSAADGVIFQTGVIERDLSLLKLSNSDEYLRAVVLSAAEQSASDSSLIDSIELYHLAGSYDKVVESVNRALGGSLASAGTSGSAAGGSGSASERLKTSGAEVGLSGAFGGAEDLYGLAQRVYSVYERDMGKRSKVSKGGWETLGTLLRLKQGMAEFAADRPDLALEVGETISQSQDTSQDLPFHNPQPTNHSPTTRAPWYQASDPTSRSPITNVSCRPSNPPISSRSTRTPRQSRATLLGSRHCWTNQSSPTSTASSSRR